jgi:hypothetical protein
MPRYQRKAQVLFTEDQYARLLQVSRREGKKLGTLLRDAAEQVYLRKARAGEKAQAVRELLALGLTPAPDDYEAWEEQYLQQKYSSHG